MKTSCFGFTLGLSLVIYLGQMSINSVLAYRLYHNDGIKTWFLPYLGLLLIPLVLIQLVSAILFLSKHGEKSSMASCVTIAILHVFQLGFIWRHINLFREIDPKSRTSDSKDFMVLQLLHTFVSMIPLLVIQTFLMYHHEISEIYLLLTMAVTLFGICWYLSLDNDAIYSSSVTVGKMVVTFFWRFGEIVSRVVSLTVFASVYYYWIFLILGLHGVTMLVCLCTSILGQGPKPQASCQRKFVSGMMYAYMYTVCFVTMKSNINAFGYCLFYVIMFFENVVLTVVWYMHSDQDSIYVNKNVLVAVSAVSFIVAMIFLIIHHNLYGTQNVREDEYDLIPEKSSCINCKLSVCSKHNIKLQRPFSAGWITQYQTAIAAGNYYKNILHDTLLDSDDESTHDILNSSGEHWQIRDTDIESIRTADKKYTSVQGTGTYSHKRFFDSDPNIKHSADADSISGGSGIYDDDWRHKPDTLMSQFTSQDTLSLLSSRTKLLTDSWDDLKKENVSLDKDPKHPKSLDILNSLIKKDLDSSFFSDGYTTDYTLESYQLPVTVLAKRRTRLFRRQPEPAYSVTSDSTDCTICSFIRNNPSSPESSRRKFSIHDDIPEESYADVSKRSTGHNHKYKKHRARSADPYRSRTVQNQQRTVQNKQQTGQNQQRVVINLNDIYSKPKRKSGRTETNTHSERTTRHRNKHVSKIPVPTSSKPKSNHVKVQRDSNKDSIPNVKQLNKLNDVHDDLILQPKVPHKPLKPRDLIFVSRVTGDSQSAYASDSGDSAFPRNTPLSSYLADDHDGISESSCEMII